MPGVPLYKDVSKYSVPFTYMNNMVSKDINAKWFSGNNFHIKFSFWKEHGCLKYNVVISYLKHKVWKVGTFLILVRGRYAGELFDFSE